MDQADEFQSMLDESDKEFILKQDFKEPMEPQQSSNNEESWTSVDAYYKGFHIKKSWGKNVSRVILMAEIDDLLKAGFTPSWNQETNKAMAPQAPVTTPTAQNDGEGLTSTCKECGSPARYREGVAKSTGKAWKGWFCTKSRDHKPFFIK